jgi:hypothetical protein
MTAGLGTASYTLASSGLAEGSYWLPLRVESQSYGEVYELETTNGVLVKVDATAPKGVCGSASRTRTGIQIAWSASDAKSGVSSSQLYVKRPGATGFSNALLAAGGTSGTLTYAPTTSGTHQFAIRSVDRAGNWEAIPFSSECSLAW